MIYIYRLYVHLKIKKDLLYGIIVQRLASIVSADIDISVYSLTRTYLPSILTRFAF
jgi:hypothetical protein